MPDTWTFFLMPLSSQHLYTLTANKEGTAEEVVEEAISCAYTVVQWHDIRQAGQNNVCGLCYCNGIPAQHLPRFWRLRLAHIAGCDVLQLQEGPQ